MGNVRSINIRLDVLLIVVLIILVVLSYLRYQSTEKFSPERRAKTIHGKLNGLFAQGIQGFTDAKKALPDLDAVEHSDARKLWNDGDFSVDSVYRSLVR